MIAALVEYINKNGKTAVKGFETVNEAKAFCERLEKRIVNGTCGGYIMTTI